MSKSKESGHAKNVANFEALITFCQGYGEDYNPKNPDITIGGLNTLKNDAYNAVLAVSKANANYKHVTDQREILFKPMSQLFTKIFHVLKSSGTNEQKLKDARSLIRKISGLHKEKETETKVVEKVAENSVTADKKKQSHSVAHKSYARTMETLRELIDLLMTDPYYQPNEAEFTIESLNNLHAALHDKIIAVNEATKDLNIARINRNKILYMADNNICKISVYVKSYVKAVFGTGSEQYKKVSPIRLYNFAPNFK